MKNKKINEQIEVKENLRKKLRIILCKNDCLIAVISINGRNAQILFYNILSHGRI